MRYFLSFIFLLCGILIYVYFRQEVLFLTPIKSFIPTPIEIPKEPNLIECILLFNIPDALWYAALLILQANPFAEENKWIPRIAISLPFLHEILQGLKLLPGTFDVADLLFYLLTLIIFLIIWKRRNKSEEAVGFKSYA